MNRILFILVLFFSFFSEIRAQKIIQMEKDGGVYKIPCMVNGAKMKMIFDTGASNVSLSMFMANYLFENGYITKDDILGKGTATVADGTIVNNILINLRDIEIAGLHINNIRATVIEGQNAPLLFGQTAIQQLGSITISNSNLILNDFKDQLSEEEIDNIGKRIDQALKDGCFSVAIQDLKKLESAVGLNAIGYQDLSIAYYFTEQYEKAIDAGALGLQDPDVTNETKIELYHWMANASVLLDNYRGSIQYIENIIILVEDCEKHSWYSKIADYYNKMRDTYKSEQSYLKAIDSFLKCHNLTKKDLLLGKWNPENDQIEEQLLGIYYFLLSSLFEQTNRT